MLTTMEPITIRFELTAIRRYECFFCGRASGKESVQPNVYSGQDDNGVICRECLAGTPTEFAACLRERAADLRLFAETLLELADDPPLRPTVDAFDAAIDVAEKRIT